MARTALLTEDSDTRVTEDGHYRVTEDSGEAVAATVVYGQLITYREPGVITYRMGAA